MSRKFVQHYRPDRLPSDADVIVIGSGMAGLATASCLAQQGAKVVVLERHSTPGGMTHSFRRKGFTWDIGLHYVGRVDDSTHAICRSLRHVTADKLAWQSLEDPYDRIEFPDSSFGFPATRARLEPALHTRFPSEARGITGYLDLTQKVARSMQVRFLGEALATWVGPWAARWSRKSLRKYGVQTTASVLDRFTQNPELRAILTGQWGNYGLPPGESGFAAHAIVAQHFMEGGSYPVGGSIEIARVIAGIVESAGGAIFTNADVERILVEGDGRDRRAVGIEMSDGEVFRAPTIISAAGAHATRTRLLSHLGDKAPYAGLEQTPLASGHCALFVGADGTPEELDIPRANIWMYPGFDHDANVRRFRDDPSADFPLLYISSGAAKDPDYQRTHPGKTSLEVILPLTFSGVEEWADTRWKRRGPQYDAFKAGIAARVEAKLIERLPKLAGRIEWSELSTPLTTNHFCATAGGEMYGMGSAVARFRHDDIAYCDLRGLELAGQDSLLFGIGGALLSGVLAAQRVEGFKVLRDAFRPRAPAPALG